MIDGHIDIQDLNQALAALKNGGVIVYPTETVWGIGCDATNSQAVRKIFDIKRRDDSKAMISLVSSLDMLARWVDEIPEAAVQLIEVTQTPLTIIYDTPVGISPELLAPDGSAAFRITSAPWARELCNLLRRPLVSTSANISGGIAPASFADIPSSVIDSADYCSSYGRELRSNLPPSSVIKVSRGNVIKIIRP